MEHRRAALLALVAASALVAAACGLYAGARGERRRRPTSMRPPAPSAQRRSLFDTAPPSYREEYYKWMWADATLLGDHGFSEADPFSWSDWLNAAGTIVDLEAYKTTKNAFRPVELMTGRENDRPGVYKPQLDDFGQGLSGLQKCQGDCDSDSDCEGALKCFQRNGYAEVLGCEGFGSKNWDYCYEGGGRVVQVQGTGVGYRVPLKFGSIDEAIDYLSEKTTTQPPTVVEKTARVTVAGRSPDASHLDASKALGFMALGSALTLASCGLYCCCARTVRGTCSHPAKGGDASSVLDSSGSDEESTCVNPKLALTDGRTPQPYQGMLHDSDLAALLADIEEEERRMLTGPRSLGPASPKASGALREEATQEVERVLGAKGAREIFGNEGSVERRAQYRRLVRLLHPDKKAVEGQRASLALRRVVECYRSLSEVR